MGKGTDIAEKFGARVRERRTAMGLSQEAFAGKCGLDRTYISGIERVVRNPTVTVVERVALALKCRLGDLLD